MEIYLNNKFLGDKTEFMDYVLKDFYIMRKLYLVLK